MEQEELEAQIRQRLGVSGKVVVVSIVASLGLFMLVLGAVYMVTYDSQLTDANNQMRLFVLSNTDNFETHNEKALKRAAGNLLRGRLVSHFVVYDAKGDVIVWELNDSHGDETDTSNRDAVELGKIKFKSKLVMATSGSDLIRMKLPSGKVVLRAYTPVRKGAMKIGDFEMGFFKSELVHRTLESLQIPAAVSFACVGLVTLIVLTSIRRLEKSKTAVIAKFFQTRVDHLTSEFNVKFNAQKREMESKDLDGGHFFNIMESVRDVAGAADSASFIRRAVLAGVRLFRCRMVSFYILDSSNIKSPLWKLSGRYDGKSYTHDIQEALDPSVHRQLNNAIGTGATELIEDYPGMKQQALLVGISAPKPIAALILSNKVGLFDSKDMVAARAFAGFLPNLFSWHTK